jgi:tetrahedral aminopeptidase
MKELIKNLVETTAPTGYEGPVRELILKTIEPLADEIRVDALGNLIASKAPTQPGEIDSKSDGLLRIMLSAHMDEIGLIASHIDEKGFVRFQSMGGVNPLTCLGGRVRFLNGAQGVIGAEKLDDFQRAPTLERMFIDLGADERGGCPVKVGDVAAFDRPFLDLGRRIVAKSMDDRIGVAVLIETLRALSQSTNCLHQVYFVFSTQEEVGLRGATTAAFGLDPDLGLAVDVTASGDTPKGSTMEVALGKGPAVKVRDSGMLADPRVVRWMADGSEKAGLPYQLEVLERGTTDARAMQTARAGIPSGCLSIPTRYIHSPSEMVDYDDVQNTVRLLTALLSKPVHLGSL